MRLTVSQKSTCISLLMLCLCCSLYSNNNNETNKSMGIGFSYPMLMTEYFLSEKLEKEQLIDNLYLPTPGLNMLYKRTPGNITYRHGLGVSFNSRNREYQKFWDLNFYTSLGLQSEKNMANTVFFFGFDVAVNCRVINYENVFLPAGMFETGKLKSFSYSFSPLAGLHIPLNDVLAINIETSFRMEYFDISQKLQGVSEYTDYEKGQNYGFFPLSLVSFVYRL